MGWLVACLYERFVFARLSACLLVCFVCFVCFIAVVLLLLLLLLFEVERGWGGGGVLFMGKGLVEEVSSRPACTHSTASRFVHTPDLMYEL